MHFAHGAGVNDETGTGAQAFLGQVVMHAGAGQ